MSKAAKKTSSASTSAHLPQHRLSPFLSGSNHCRGCCGDGWVMLADGEPDQAAQSAVGVGSNVVSQRDRKSGAPCSSRRCILVDAWRARRDPAEQPARQVRVRDNPTATDQDRCARDRTHRAYPHPAADQLPGASVSFPAVRTPPDAVWPMSRGAACPDVPPIKADQPPRVAPCVASHRSSGCGTSSSCRSRKTGKRSRRDE